MSTLTVLPRDWKMHLAGLVSNAKAELFISSPYVTHEGSNFVADNLSSSFSKSGQLIFLTDLSPLNIAQGATNPNALQILEAAVPNFILKHLPRLHAKVYVADANRAIVTSGNLTAGGLALNYECGVEVAIPTLAQEIHNDIMDYANLGADVSSSQLLAYCQISDRVRAAFRKERAATAKSVRKEFTDALRNAEDELIKLRLAEGAIHTVFAKTVLYLLKNRTSLNTQNIHQMVQAMHPDLCDDAIDRVIDGKRFGKKWKHAVRTAQQHLKRRELIELVGDQWKLKRNR